MESAQSSEKGIAWWHHFWTPYGSFLCCSFCRCGYLLLLNLTPSSMIYFIVFYSAETVASAIQAKLFFWKIGVQTLYFSSLWAKLMSDWWLVHPHRKKKVKSHLFYKKCLNWWKYVYLDIILLNSTQAGLLLSHLMAFLHKMDFRFFSLKFI